MNLPSDNFGNQGRRIKGRRDFRRLEKFNSETFIDKNKNVDDCT